MNKTVKAICLMLSVFMLGGCADTSSDDSVISGNPFEETEANAADDYEEAFGKYQLGSIRYSNYSVSEDKMIEYNGGNIELSFDADSTGNQYDVEAGYMAFINGIPQKLSLNGGENGELVCVSQAPNQKQKVTLSISPAVTEKLSGEDTLQLKLICIFNPSYKPSGNYKSFGNAHSGQAFLEKDIKVNAPLEVSECMTAVTEYESFVITDETSSIYKLGNLRKDAPTAVAIKDFDTNEQPVLRNGKLKINLLLYGSEQYNYNVYLYVNHDRIKFNGCDYLSTKVKSGYLNVFETEFEGINERDIIYAVAVPVDSETGAMNTRKSESMLILDENSETVNTGEVQSAVSDTPSTPSDGSKVTDIYSYEPVGYIDEEQRYLLLSRPSFRYEDKNFWDYIVYDETDKAVIGTLNAPGDFHSLTYGNGVITLGVQYTHSNTEDLQIAVYNERLECIREVYGDEMSETYIQKYDPKRDCWYFHKNDHFCRANSDFSDITAITDYAMRDYYITEDRIIYYRTVYDYSNPASDADIFGIMDLDGNVIKETKAAPYGVGEFRIGRAGDYIYFMSPLARYTEGLIREPMEGVIFYNLKTNEQKTVYPEEYSERSYCKVSPDGKHLVTGKLVLSEDRSSFTDNIVKLYDVGSGKLLDTKAMGAESTAGGFFVFNDRAVFGWNGSIAYTFGQ